MRLVLFQPDIPQNVGTLMRLSACVGVPLDIIEPCGFPLGAKALARAGMDYVEGATYRLHASWPVYRAQASGRLILLSTRGQQSYGSFTFAADDCLIVGAESAGVPQEVHGSADAVLRIPLRSGFRSLNVAVAAAMVLGEALRQTVPEWTQTAVLGAA